MPSTSISSAVVSPPTLLPRSISGERGCRPGPVRHDPEPLDGTSADKMFLDDLVHVGHLEAAVPDALRIDDQDRPLVMLLVAAHAGRPHPGQLAALDLIPK